jgi:hypothetical protein
MNRKGRWFLFFVVNIWSSATFGQTYISQSFEGFFPPENWILAWEIGSQNWSRTNINKFDGVYSTYHNDFPALQQAWIITPSQDFSGTTRPVINYMDAVNNRHLADAHRLLISTNYNGTGNPVLFEWDTLCEMIGTNVWDYAANIPISDYKTSGVYIAWEYYGANASEWFVDSIRVVEGIPPPPNDSCHNAIPLTFPYPDTVFDNNEGATFDCVESLIFTNAVWYSIELPYVCNEVFVTVRSLEMPLQAFTKVMALDCSCSDATFIDPEAFTFTSDTSARMNFIDILGPTTAYLPMEVTRFQDFSLEINVRSCCQNPSDLNAINITPTTADLVWSENGTSVEWDIELGLYGFNPTGTADLSVHNNPYHLTGLIPASCYEYYVRALCIPNGYSDWVGPYMFCTGCPDAVTDYQYLMNFEPPVWPPTCWTVESLSDSTWRGGYTTASPLTRAAWVGDFTGQYQDEWLISPVFDLSGVDNPQLSFDWMASFPLMVTYDLADISLYVSTNAGGSWGAGIALWDEDIESSFDSWRWYYKQIDLALYAGLPQVTFAFRYSGSNAGGIIVDNFMIGPATDSTYWTGDANQFWYHLGNWSGDVPFRGTCTCVPNVALAGKPLPVLNNAAQANDMQVSPGAFLNLLGGTTLYLTSQPDPPLLSGEGIAPGAGMAKAPVTASAGAPGKPKDGEQEGTIFFKGTVNRSAAFHPSCPRLLSDIGD